MNNARQLDTLIADVHSYRLEVNRAVLRLAERQAQLAARVNLLTYGVLAVLIMQAIMAAAVILRI